ncbi:MAG: tripartite tricarboxylate transporter substrate binding protein [Xanthobacteraceae bacterium]|nr:tripartite tricarboxylate transporter substrate binding protein [Xanthobacteraceae bacterium]
MMTVVLRALALLCAVLLGSPANAQSYPAKPITIVVPFGPGSGSDLIGRIVAQRLSAVLGQSVIVENKPGANGAIAALQVARSAPDGYTIFLGTNTPMSAAPSLNKTIAYDPVKDFAALCRIGSFTQLLLVHPDIPAKSIQELVAHAKANPGKLSFASANASSVVAGETLKRTAGLDLLHVPYRSSPPAVQDVLGGRVSMLFTDMATGLPHHKSGALRGLATTRLQRSALVPELPTLDESGVKGFDMDSWAGFFLPAGTPQEVVTKLNAELRKIIDNPEVKAQIAATGFEAFSSSTDELDAFVKAQLVKWTKMIKDAGIQPE